MEPETKPEISRIIDLAQMLSQPRALARDQNAAPFIVIPDSSHVVGLEEFMPLPVRKRGTAQFDDLDSFCRYVNQHKVAETRIFASEKKIAAILDFHGNQAGWCEHSAVIFPVKGATMPEMYRIIEEQTGIKPYMGTFVYE